MFSDEKASYGYHTGPREIRRTLAKREGKMIHRIMVFLRIVMPLPVIAILAGCMPVATVNITQETSLGENEGILIAKIRTNIKDCKIFVHGKDETRLRAMLDMVHSPEDLRAIKIKGGEAYFSGIVTASFATGAPRRQYFSIEPNTVTYVGDLVVQLESEEDEPRGYVLVIDREDSTVNEARLKFPWIFERLPYRKSIPRADR